MSVLPGVVGGPAARLVRQACRAESLAALLAVLSCATVPLFAADGPAMLLGRWRSAEMPAGGVGALIEFRDNGTFDFSPGTAASTPYKVDGDALVLAPGGKGAVEQRQRMVWLNDNKLVLSQQAGEAEGETLLVRGSPAVSGDARSLTGEWTTQIKMPERTVTGRYIFRKDGTLLVLISFLTARGIYRVQGAHIHWELAEQPAGDGEFKLEGEILILPKPGGGEMKLKRY